MCHNKRWDIGIYQASLVDLVAVCFLFVKYWSSLVGKQKQERRWMLGNKCNWVLLVTLPVERSLQNNRGPCGVSRGPCVGALPWACLSGYKRGPLQAECVWWWDLEGRFFLSACESRALTGNHSGGGVCGGIHHNIVCPRASFSHTRIIEIALTVAHTVTQKYLCTIYTQDKYTLLPHKMQLCQCTPQTHTHTRPWQCLHILLLHTS